MVVVAGRTALQVRQSVGKNVGAVRVSTASSEIPDSSSLIDDTLIGPDDEYKGKHVRMSGVGDLAGEQSRVSTYTESGTDATVSPAFSGSINTADGYEMWDEEFDPTDIDEFIRDAVLDLYGEVFVHDWDTSFYGDGDITRFAIPTGITHIQGIDYRASIHSTSIHTCDAVWDESTATNATVSVDTKLNKRGNSSMKFVVAAGASANDILATDSFSAKNISDRTHVEFWIWSDIATVAGDLLLLLDDTASCASPLESLSVPALTARTWNRVQVALANPELDTALISVGLKYVTDNGAQILFLDDIEAVHIETATWRKIPLKAWGIDHEARQMWFSDGVRIATAHKMIRLQALKNPTIPSSDSDTFDVDDWYVICRATELAFSSHAQHGDDEKRQTQADRWSLRADKAKDGHTRLSGRAVD